MKIVRLIAVLILSFCGFTQGELVIPKTDTIKLDYRAGGVDLDSANAVYQYEYGLRPGGGLGYLNELNLASKLAKSNDHLLYKRDQSKRGSYRTSLPYLGFNYTFGSNATQNVNLDYSHTFSDKNRLNFRYHRRVSNGFLRNEAYKLNDVHLLYQRVGLRYSTKLDAYFSDDSFGENGGIQTDTLLQEFDLIFTPIKKGDANTSVKRAEMKWQNYLSLKTDSLLSFGLTQRLNFDLINREYTESSDTLFALYDNVFIDSTNTRDQYQTAALTNGLGYFFSTPSFQIDALLNHTYWRNQNLGQNRDTSELAISSHMFLQLKNIKLRNQFQLNVLGALGEVENEANLTIPIRAFNFNGTFLFKNKLPTPYQRESFGNHFQWKLTELKTQQTIAFKAGISIKKNYTAGIDFMSSTVSNGLYFINDAWRQDTLNVINASTLSAYGGFHLKKFHFYPRIKVNFNSANYQYQPLLDARTRMVFKTGVFKAKKLVVAFGVDLGYQTEYTSLTYMSNIGVLQFAENSFTSGELLNLGAFFGMQIDQFRFHFSVDNISNAWNDQTTRIDPSYPIMPLFIRLGLSWDFFN